MSFPQAIADQQAVIFDRLGEDATWNGGATPVRVIRREADEQIRTQYSDLVAEGRTVRVRQVDVASPTIGDVVQILDDAEAPVTGAQFVVAAEPMLNRRRVWTCPVRLVGE